MKIKMSYNENIKTFDDIVHHLELKDKRLEATKSYGQAYVADSNLREALDFKNKRNQRSFKKEKEFKKSYNEAKSS